MNRLSGFRSPVATLASLVLFVALAVGCGRALDDDPNAPVLVTISQTYLTIENKAGSALVDGVVELVPSGVLTPYRANLPRIEAGSNREVLLDRFSGAGGARFLRGGTRIRSVRLTATDVTGKTYKREVAFK
jgi:hypothetical protein